ncbi:uncharacterized protein [Amphiura filiformis]|uniref:uncharacterized protein n=1 Tax=Amphiura filiformis TaxID=82378 RepID=UPI003B21E40B
MSFNSKYRRRDRRGYFYPEFDEDLSSRHGREDHITRPWKDLRDLNSSSNSSSSYLNSDSDIDSFTSGFQDDFSKRMEDGESEFNYPESDEDLYTSSRKIT